MPFRSPYSTYQPGDLLYGLAGPRGNLAAHFGVAVGQICTIDEYDIFAADRGYAGLRHDQGFIDSLTAHQKYSSVLNYDLADNNNWNNEPIKTAAYAKRKCKGGLNWITQNTTRRIHFLLDGLEMESVPAKNFTTVPYARDHPQGKAPAALAWTAKERSITGAELRWVYRNRNNIRVQKQIQFWKKSVKWQTTGFGKHTSVDTFSPCPPPWSDKGQPASVRNAWAAYIPTNVP